MYKDTCQLLNDKEAIEELLFDSCKQFTKEQMQSIQVDNLDLLAWYINALSKKLKSGKEHTQENKRLIDEAKRFGYFIAICDGSAYSTKNFEKI